MMVLLCQTVLLCRNVVITFEQLKLVVSLFSMVIRSCKNIRGPPSIQLCEGQVVWINFFRFSLKKIICVYVWVCKMISNCFVFFHCTDKKGIKKSLPCCVELVGLWARASHHKKNLLNLTFFVESVNKEQKEHFCKRMRCIFFFNFYTKG